MFREKLAKDPLKRGYLYIRESYYDRDRRTLKRKPARLGDGIATQNRGKYSKKKDIYCGRIYEVELQKLDTFREYIRSIGCNDYILYIKQSSFEQIIDQFVNYILYVYGIENKEYFNKKKVYTIGDGYISTKIIEWLKKFKLQANFDSPSEMKRFYYRCIDCGIFDEDVINSLYLKIVPDIHREEIKEEIAKMQEINMEKQEYEGYRDFIKNCQ